jgi:hypothetical protein
MVGGMAGYGVSIMVYTGNHFGALAPVMPCTFHAGTRAAGTTKEVYVK